jgi:hypothetical protein
MICECLFIELACGGLELAFVELELVAVKLKSAVLELELAPELVNASLWGLFGTPLPPEIKGGGGFWLSVLVSVGL